MKGRGAPLPDQMARYQEGGVEASIDRVSDKRHYGDGRTDVLGQGADLAPPPVLLGRARGPQLQEPVVQWVSKPRPGRGAPPPDQRAHLSQNGGIAASSETRGMRHYTDGTQGDVLLQRGNIATPQMSMGRSPGPRQQGPSLEPSPSISASIKPVWQGYTDASNKPYRANPIS